MTLGPHMVIQTRTLITRVTGDEIRQVDMRCLSQGELNCAPGSTAWIDWSSITCTKTPKTMYLQVPHTEVTTDKCVNLRPNPTKGVPIGTAWSHSWRCHILCWAAPSWLSQQWHCTEMWYSSLEAELAQKSCHLTVVFNFYHSFRLHTLPPWDKQFNCEARGNLLDFSNSADTSNAISYAHSWGQDEICDCGLQNWIFSICILPQLPFHLLCMTQVLARKWDNPQVQNGRSMLFYTIQSNSMILNIIIMALREISHQMLDYLSGVSGWQASIINTWYYGTL